jgi:hypothetical protein
MPELADREARRVKIFGIRPETDGGPGIADAHRPDLGQVRCLPAVFEGDGVSPPAAPDLHLEAGGEGIDHRHAHPVKAAGKPVVLVAEFSAGMQFRHDHLDPGHPFLGVQVDGHAPPVIAHRQGTILMEHHLDLLGKAGDGLVHRVVDDFLGKVIRPARIRIHSRPPPDRIEPTQDLEGRGVVVPVGNAVKKISVFDDKPP